MDPRTYAKRMGDAERGRRLLKNKDYVDYKNQLESELAGLYHKLRDTITTDPKIAELQGALKKLESVLDRPHEWIEVARRTAVQQINDIEAANLNDTEDYESG